MPHGHRPPEAQDICVPLQFLNVFMAHVFWNILGEPFATSSRDERCPWESAVFTSGGEENDTLLNGIIDNALDRSD